MPTFLTIDNDDFERDVKEIKKVDKSITEPDISYRSKITSKMNRTTIT